MRIETSKFKTDDNMDIIIVIEFHEGYKGFEWRIADIKYKTSRQRNYRYLSVEFQNDYKYKMLNIDGRRKYELNRYIEFCGKEQIKNALVQAYDFIKPDIDKLLCTED